MALVYADRVKETSTTTGTGTYDLAGPATGFEGFVTGIGNANTCYYCAEDGTNWEVGIGTVTDAATDTLARTTILQSSNADAAVNWAAGTRTIFVTIPALVVERAATTAVSGISELATTTEVLTSTDTVRTVTPDAIAALWEKGADTASAGTITIGEGGYFHITGTTTITDIDFTTAVNGRGVKVIFDGILTLTHNATTLILPGGANITTAAGDRAEFVQDAGDNIICLWYTRADGTAISASVVGTWTPALKFGGASVGMTYGTQSGKYVKNGRMVTATFTIILTAKGSSTGNATLEGVPFAADGEHAGVCGYYAVLVSMAGAPMLYLNDTLTVMNLYDGSGTTAVAMTQGNVGATATIIGTITYRTAS